MFSLCFQNNEKVTKIVENTYKIKTFSMKINHKNFLKKYDSFLIIYLNKIYYDIIII